jgi:UDP-2-acetamido-2-deoxy-ribo-hexuluronate aminotransferase
MTTKPMNIKMVDTVGQYHRMKAEIDTAVMEVLETGAYINGPAVGEFRKNLASYLGAKHVIACANGTDALQIALMALDLQPGDEVITSPFTFFATAEVVALLGLRPVFVDVETDTFNIDVSGIEAAITPRTKVIIPVHLFGLTAHMEPLMAIARKHNLHVVEDAAQSIGGEYIFADGRRVHSGLIGDIGSTSFYPSKNLGAYGDAGALYTQDDRLGAILQSICNHGARVKYHHERIGVNSRLDTIQAAILNVKLQYLNQYVASRNEVASQYDSLFRGVQGIEIPGRRSYSTHAFHQYTLRISEGREKRDRMKKMLEERGVPTMIYYPIPLHLQIAAKPYGYNPGDMPVSEQLSGEVLSLPIHTEMDQAQTDFIAQTVLDCFRA